MSGTVKRAYTHGHIYREVDGYYVLGLRDGGFLEAHQLREIADELDRLNKPWDDQVKRELDRLGSGKY